MSHLPSHITHRPAGVCKSMKSATLLCLLLSLPAIVQAADPVLHLDAGNHNTVSLHDDATAVWESTNGTVRLTQTDAAQFPTEGPKLNGRTTLHFDGNDFLRGPAVLPEGDNTFTIIGLWKPDRVATQAIFEQASAGAGRRTSLLQVGNAYGFNGQANDFHSAVSIQPNTWRLSTIVVNGMKRDNVIVIDNDAMPVTGTIDIELHNPGIAGTIIGRKFVRDSEYLQGDIAEIRVFDTVLNQQQLTGQLDTIKKTWGLTFKSQVPEIASADETLSPATGIKTSPTEQELVYFETKVRPLLVQHCYECHSGDAKTVQAGLRLDGVHWIDKGGDSGPLVVPGKPDESLLIESVRYESYEMPPRAQLPDADVDALVKWVEMGAPWPAETDDTVMEAITSEEPYDWEKFRQEHWAFRPVEKPTPPAVQNPEWVRTPVDAFVLARLEQNQLSPNDQASRRILIRRAYLDLLGLPPQPSDVDRFLADSSPQAFENLVNELLESKHYGERWARHWLDVARYSDGLGGFLDSEDLPKAWHYRDWVVNALNTDVPYDEFVRRQIAGDVLPGNTDPVATGFFAVGPTYRSDGGDPAATAQALAETLADRVDTFSRAFLGLTVACARCHDHKFDPITIKDYYALAGVFNNTRVGEHPLAPAEDVEKWQLAQAAVDRCQRTVDKWLDDTAKALNTTRKQVESQLSPAQKTQLAELRQQLKQQQDAMPTKFETAHVLQEFGTSDMHVALRGDLRRKGDQVPHRFMQIFTGRQFTPFTDGSGRRELAFAVTQPDNPLIARVIVNRVWQWHFGQGLVRTPGNFGILGEAPTHPDLLDWLVSDFVQHGWSLKHLHRRIMLSATWQTSSIHDEGKFAIDGDNRLLWRMNPRRLDVEVWRDSMLAVTGELDRQIGGVPDEDILNSPRRSLYAKISRSGDRFDSDAFFRLFDFPAAQATAPMRVTTTVPQQYLFMMNNPFMGKRAAALADSLQSYESDEDRIQQAYARLYSRPANASEVEFGMAFLNNDSENWPMYAQVLLSAHEFMQAQ